MAPRFTCAALVGSLATLSCLAIGCSSSSGDALFDPLNQDGGVDATATDAGTSDATSKSDGGPDAAGDASVDGPVSDTGAPNDAAGEPTCDATASPKDSPCVVNESLGIFVSASLGNDATGAGTRKAPFKSLAKAISEAKSAKKRVYACGESFTEALVLPSNIAIYGGLKCTSAAWPWDGAKRTVTTAADASSPALKIPNGGAAISVSDFEFNTPDATSAGGSSIGGWIENATGIRLERVRIVAGKGEKGAAPEAKPASAAAGAPGKNGVGAVCGPNAPGQQLGGDAAESACTAQSGAGGTALKNANGYAGSNGEPEGMGAGTANDGRGGVGGTKNGNDCETGHNGANGNEGTNATVNTTAAKVSAQGYQPVDGIAGVDGSPGQGGGGGGASAGTPNCVGASGGSGGSGGCGGKGGKGGKGGGASIGLVVLESKGGLELLNCEIEASNGGNAGAGQDGGSGGGGGLRGNGGGAAEQAKSACDGGKGGGGGKGGAGSGGRGGATVALWWSGSVSPAGEGVTLKKGTPGKGGAGGDGSPATAGPDGIGSDSYQQPSP